LELATASPSERRTGSGERFIRLRLRAWAWAWARAGARAWTDRRL